MRYIHLNNGVVDAILPEFDDKFPGVPIEKRVSDDFLFDCIKSDDETIDRGFIYDKTNDTFISPNLKPIINDLNVAITEKISELSSKCNETIENGFDFEGEHYSLTPDDQRNMDSLSTILASKGYPVPYHADGKGCKEYDAEVFLKLVASAIMFKESQLTYFNQLKQYVKTLDNIDNILAIKYGDKLTGEYLETYNTITENFRSRLLNSNE